MKRKLIILSGSPCVGKTTVAEQLCDSYDNSARSDGDGLWMVNSKDNYDSRLRNGDKNMSFVLANYLNSDFEYVIFSSVVMTYESIRKPILKDIAAFAAVEYETIVFTLTCSEETLIERHDKRGDEGETDFHWLHLPPHFGDYLINTDNKTVEQIVDELRAIIDGESKTLETERLTIKKVSSSAERYEWDIVKKDTGNFLGKIAFFDIDENLRSCTIGYHTEEAHQNKGYMTEAITCVLRFMILEVGFNRITGGHQTDNPASGRVMAKAGMKCEGTLRQDFMNEDGTVVDSILYSMIRQDLE